jgi:hypothetical protein
MFDDRCYDSIARDLWRSARIRGDSDSLFWCSVMCAMGCKARWERIAPAAQRTRLAPPRRPRPCRLAALWFS